MKMKGQPVLLMADLKRVGLKTVAASVLGLGVFLAGCDAEVQRSFEALSSEADASISNLMADHDSRVINGQMDYGVTVSFTVTNVGKNGIISVSPWVSSSEGEWSRQQKLQFVQGESLRLSYFFPEPTINASNIQYGLKAFP